MSRTPIFLLPILCVALAGAAHSQTTGTLTGHVTGDGKPLAGASITVTSPALITPRAATTGVAGTYVVTSLPPGRYNVELSAPHHVTVNKPADVLLGAVARADAELATSEDDETMTVTAATTTPGETPSLSTHFLASAIDALPLRRRLANIADLAPGTDRDANALSIDGASNGPLRAIDGARTAAPADVTIGAAIDQLAVLQAGIGSEYGQSSGGVVMLTTRSGGDTTSGSVRATVRRHAGGVTTPLFEETLGGAVMAERLWYFAAASQERDETSRTRDRRYQAKLTGALGPWATLAANDARSSEAHATGLDLVVPVGVAGKSIEVRASRFTVDGAGTTRSLFVAGSALVDPGRLGTHRLIAGIDHNSAATSSTAFFADDTWSLMSRLNLSGGIRFERSEGTDRVLPRAGFTYDLTGDGRHRLVVSSGSYSGETAALAHQWAAGYVWRISNNGSVRGDFVHRNAAADVRYAAVQTEAEYRFLGIITLAGNLTHRFDDVPFAGTRNRLNAWVTISPPVARGELTASLLERARNARRGEAAATTDAAVVYRAPLARTSVLVKLDLLDLFGAGPLRGEERGDDTTRGVRLAVGAAF